MEIRLLGIVKGAICMHKRIFSVILIFAFMLSFCSCRNKSNETTNANENISLESIIDANSETLDNSGQETSAEEEFISAVKDQPQKTEKADLPDIMYETINGETIKLKFDKAVPPKSTITRNRLSYVSDEGDTAEYDEITGELVYLSLNVEKSPIADINATPLPESECIAIAEAFIKKHCDLKQYKFTRAKYSYIDGTYVDYVKFIHGIPTSDGISVNVWNDRRISFFAYNPHVFDDIKIDKIDETPLITDLENQIKKYWGDSIISYNIDSKRIAVLCEEPQTPKMEYQVEINAKSSADKPTITAGEVYYCPLK